LTLVHAFRSLDYGVNHGGVKPLESSSDTEKQIRAESALIALVRLVARQAAAELFAARVSEARPPAAHLSAAPSNQANE
jgi:hypothetical protein